MSYIMDDSGTSLRFICPYHGRLVEKIAVVWGLFSIVIFTVIVSLVLFSPSPDSSQTDWWGIGVFGFFLVTIFLLYGIELLWQLIGKEVLEVSLDDIIISHWIMGFGISRRYPADKIEGVFVSQARDRNIWHRLFFRRDVSGFSFFKHGKVALNCGRYWLLSRPKTFRFGTGLTEEEAEHIVSMIHNRFPHYRYQPPGVQ
jgi:hypothetical protein